MQGVWTDGVRPATKAAFKREAATNPTAVVLEATSIFGNEYGGPLTGAPAGNYYVVGPDPHTSRKWYAQIKVYGSGGFHII